MSRTVSIDFETRYDEKAGFGIRVQGTMGYLRDERFDPYLISVSDGKETWAGPTKAFCWESLNGATLVSHNAYFDSAVLKEMQRRGWAPQIDYKEWHCTANLSAYLCLRRDLARASKYLLGKEVDKSVRKDASGKGWAELVKEDGGKSMLEYARTDAELCLSLWTNFSDRWPELERQLSKLTIDQGQRGVQIDHKKLRKYLHVAQSMLIQAEADLPWISEGKAPTSPRAVAEECRKYHIPAPPVKAHEGDDAFEEWERTYAPKHRWIKAYSDFRVIQKFISTLETVKSRLMDGEVFPFDQLYFGAHTGRWSGSGGFNMQNMRKDPLFCDENHRLITDSEKLKEIFTQQLKDGSVPGYVAYVLDIRALFIARPNKKMIVCDLSQIEPRVLAWLVGDKTMLANMASGQSPYEAHARATMDWKGGDLKKSDKDLYALAKARVLGLGYGCGWQKFITVAAIMAGLDITVDDPELVPETDKRGEIIYDSDGKPKMVSGYGTTSKRIVNDYRSSNPLITGFWRKLDDDLRSCVGSDYVIELASGRKLTYPEVRQEWVVVKDDTSPTKMSNRQKITALTFDGKRGAEWRKPFYGGILCENVVQATARDVFGEHLVTLNKTRGISVLWGVHDEAVCEVDTDISVKDVESIMSRTPDWIPGCPISAEGKEVLHYCK
mgnify:CR=1 FL=1